MGDRILERGNISWTSSEGFGEKRSGDQLVGNFDYHPSLSRKTLHNLNCVNVRYLLIDFHVVLLSPLLLFTVCVCVCAPRELHACVIGSSMAERLEPRNCFELLWGFCSHVRVTADLLDPGRGCDRSHAVRGGGGSVCRGAWQAGRAWQWK